MANGTKKGAQLLSSAEEAELADALYIPQNEPVPAFGPSMALYSMPVDEDEFVFKPGVAEVLTPQQEAEMATGRRKAAPKAAAGRTSRAANGGVQGGFDTPAAIGAAAAGLGALGQYFLAVKPATQTAQDVLNQQRLTELRAKEAELKGQVAGKMSAADRQELELLESAQMAPVRALATQQMQRGEAERASMGATRAARQALESERIGRQQVTQAAQQVGLQKAQRFLQQRAEKKAELARTQREIDERTAYESGVERNRLAFIGDTISGLAQLGGRALGGYIPKAGAPSTDQRAAFRAMYPEFQGLPDSTVDAAIEGLTAARKG